MGGDTAAPQTNRSRRAGARAARHADALPHRGRRLELLPRGAGDINAPGPAERTRRPSPPRRRRRSPRRQPRPARRVAPVVLLRYGQLTGTGSETSSGLASTRHRNPARSTRDGSSAGLAFERTYSNHGLARRPRLYACSACTIRELSGALE